MIIFAADAEDTTAVDSFSGSLSSAGDRAVRAGRATVVPRLLIISRKNGCETPSSC